MEHFEEIGRSGQFQAPGDQYTGERIYFVDSAVSEADAATQALGQLMDDIGGQVLFGSVLNSIRPQETEVAGCYKVTMGFSPDSLQQQPFEIPKLEFSFASSSETVFVSQQTVAYGTDPADFGNAIGVQLNANGTLAVNGMQAPTDGFAFGYRFVLPIAAVNDAYVATIGNCHLHTNNATFNGFPPGQVLFLSASGGQRDSETFEMSFNFARRADRVSQTVGGVSGVDIPAWWIVDPFWIENEDATADIWATAVDAVYVHRVYNQANLGAMFPAAP